MFLFIKHFMISLSANHQPVSLSRNWLNQQYCVFKTFIKLKPFYKNYFKENNTEKDLIKYYLKIRMCGKCNV